MTLIPRSLNARRDRSARSISFEPSFHLTTIGLFAPHELIHFAGLTCDNAQSPNRLHDGPMPELIAKANQAILESHYLRREGRSLRLRASALASQLGQAMGRSQRAEREFASLKTMFDRAESIGFSGP